MIARPTEPPLVAHFIYRLATGGLENGLVNLINAMPADRYRHAIICLTNAGAFQSRLKRSDVAVHELNENSGLGITAYGKLWRLLRRVEPQILHTRNIATLEGQICAFAAGVPGRIHGEHGRDVQTVNGTPFRYRVWRRVAHPFVNTYTAVSNFGATAITDVLPHASITPVYNGVDTTRFFPRPASEPPSGVTPFEPGVIVIGSVSRLERIKDPITLVRAFGLLLQQRPDLRPKLRLALVGDGRLRTDVLDLVRSAELDGLVWFAGDRHDIPTILRSFNFFVLSSITEGLSNTLLEAMATGLPVIATAVGGNPELVTAETGTLVPPSDPAAIADALNNYLNNVSAAQNHGLAARQRVLTHFSIEAMVNGYLHLYDRLLQSRAKVRAGVLLRSDR